IRWSANSERSFFSTSAVIDPALGLMINSFVAFELSEVPVRGRGLRRPAEYLFPEVVARALVTLNCCCRAGASSVRRRTNGGPGRRSRARRPQGAGGRTAG